jgi:threonylcarbamoyladenosine tRNA methylthiotransferase MtaB
MDSENLTPQVTTFGCKVNAYDTGLMIERLRRSGHFTNDDLKNIHILNSCAVTREATTEVLRHARRIKRTNPNTKIVLTGCSAQVDGALLDEDEALDLVIGNSHKAEVPDLIQDLLKGRLNQKVFRTNIFRKDDLGAGGGLDDSHTRAFLKIQDGCNSFCSFCVIPYARGTSRSLTINHLIERVHELQAVGYQEVVFTGVHIGDYRDEENGRILGLEDLVENILNFCTIPRIRISSLEPIEITDRLLELYSNERLCPHFHISLQSAQSQVLRKMKRKYTSEDVEACFDRIFKKMVVTPFIGMDVIVGFPGESEEDFHETYKRLEALPWNHIHVFPYSERKGTRAELMPDSVNMATRKQRAKVLRALSQKRYEETAKHQVGQVKRVLLSLKQGGRREGFLQGVSRDFWKVNLPVVDHLDLNKEHEVKVSGFDPRRLGAVPPLQGAWI